MGNKYFHFYTLLEYPLPSPLLFLHLKFEGNIRLFYFSFISLSHFHFFYTIARTLTKYCFYNVSDFPEISGFFV